MERSKSKQQCLHLRAIATEKFKNAQEHVSQSFGAFGRPLTAPHLKYGVFPKRRNNPNRIPALPLNTGCCPYPGQYSTQPRVNRVDVLKHYTMNNTRDKKSKTKKAKGPLVLRSFQKTDTKMLSKSETMHLDIKPKRNIAP